MTSAYPAHSIIPRVSVRAFVALAALACCLAMGVSSSSARAADPALILSASASEVPGCVGARLEITLRLENPDTVDVGGYQFFLGFPAQYFELVGHEALDINSFVTVGGPAPAGSGYRACDGSIDGWADGAGVDVASVVATVFGEGGVDPFRGTAADLLRFSFRPRGESTDGLAVEFGAVSVPCHSGLDQAPHVFDPEGRSLSLGAVLPVSVRVGEGQVAAAGFSCTDLEDRVALVWAAPTAGDYLGYRIYRNGAAFATFPIKSILSYEDASPPSGTVVYELAVLLPGGGEGCRLSCTLERGGGVRFFRGDANRDGKLNVTDGISVLEHLFRGGPMPCQDSADFDDSGSLNLTDAVAILRYLFEPGDKPAPPSPFPDVGIDPTDDALTCDA